MRQWTSSTWLKIFPTLDLDCGPLSNRRQEKWHLTILLTVKSMLTLFDEPFFLVQQTELCGDIACHERKRLDQSISPPSIN
jgi:hypothetical protein